MLDLCFENKILLAGPISIMSLIKTATHIKNEKNRSLVSKIKEATAIYDKYAFLKNLVKTIDSHKATQTLKQVITAAYGSNQSLEEKLLN